MAETPAPAPAPAPEAPAEAPKAPAEVKTENPEAKTDTMAGIATNFLEKNGINLTKVAEQVKDAADKAESEAKTAADKAAAEKLAREIAATDAQNMSMGEVANAATTGLFEGITKLLENANLEKLIDELKKFFGEMSKGVKPAEKTATSPDAKKETVSTLPNYNGLVGANATTDLKREVTKNKAGKKEVNLTAVNKDIEFKMPADGTPSLDAKTNTLTITTKNGEVLLISPVTTLNTTVSKEGQSLFTLKPGESVTINAQTPNDAGAKIDTPADELLKKIPGIELKPEKIKAKKTKPAAPAAVVSK